MAGPDRKLRVAVIGAGAISKFHFTAWRAATGVDLVALCDIDGERGRRRAAEFAVPAVYGTVEELLDRENPDALDIVTPLETHAPILRLAAARGIDCLCQKPFTEDLASAERLAAEVTPRIRLMVNENRRHYPPFRTAREWIETGLVGKVHQVAMSAFRAHYLTAPDGTYTGTPKTPAMVSGPRLFVTDAFIHQIDVLRSLLGPLRTVAARALATEDDFKGDTLASAFLETEAGAPVVLAGSNVARGYPKRFNDRLEVLGSKGSIIWQDGALRLLGDEPREVDFDIEGPGYAVLYQSCFTIAAQHFRDAVVGSAPFATDISDNLETLRLVEDIYRLSRR